MKIVEKTKVVDGLKMSFMCILTDEEYQKYEELMEQGMNQDEALKIAQPKK